MNRGKYILSLALGMENQNNKLKFNDNNTSTEAESCNFGHSKVISCNQEGVSLQNYEDIQEQEILELENVSIEDLPVEFADGVIIAEIENGDGGEVLENSNIVISEKNTMAEVVEISETNDNKNNEKKSRKKRYEINKLSWKRNLNREKRMKGESFLGFSKSENMGWRNDTERPERKMGRRCCGKLCNKSTIYQCAKLSDQEREEIFHHFWKDLTWDQKKIFIVNNVLKVEPKRRRKDAINPEKKSVGFQYYLKCKEKSFRVCKTMFLNTLSIGEWSVREWCKQSKDGIVTSNQSKLAQRSSNRLLGNSNLKAKKRREHLSTWLDKLPKLPSHYARSNTKKLYLEDGSIKSKKQLYKIYKELCSTDDVKPLSSYVFDEIIDTKNIGLFKPRKDQCDTCISYECGNLDIVSKIEYDNHIVNKDRARIEKEKDKKEAIQGKCHTITMDLQAVLLSPKMYASKLYYKTKLRVHNFTLYNLASHQSSNFVWHEGNGDVNASNFISCIIDYIDTHFKQSKNKIILYSDNCGYQNKNVNLSNALLTYAVKENKIIEQKFLVKGHSQMECDSVHSLIERRLDRRDVYLPSDYAQIIRQARDEPFPLDVKYLNYDFFKDYAIPNFQWYKSIRPGHQTTDPYVSDISCLKYSPDGIIYYKTSFDMEYEPIRKTKSVDKEIVAYPQLYSSPPKVSLEKYTDLIEITSVLDKTYNLFYENLPHELGKKQKKDQKANENTAKGNKENKKQETVKQQRKMKGSKKYDNDTHKKKNKEEGKNMKKRKTAKNNNEDPSCSNAKINKKTI